jgi:ATP synthase protein I
MAEKEPNDGGSPMSGYAKYSAMGFQMIVIIGGFTYGGYKIDTAFHHTTQWVTAALSLTGVFISLFIVIRCVKS